MSTPLHERVPAEDPVAVYDTMREAATRLIALHAERITVGDPAMVEMRKIRAEARAVNTHDIPAQKAAATDFNARAACPARILTTANYRRATEVSVVRRTGSFPTTVTSTPNAAQGLRRRAVTSGTQGDTLVVASGDSGWR